MLYVNSPVALLVGGRAGVARRSRPKRGPALPLILGAVALPAWAVSIGARRQAETAGPGPSFLASDRAVQTGFRYRERGSMNLDAQAS